MHPNICDETWMADDGNNSASAEQTLQQLEDAARLFEEASKAKDISRISPAFPGRLSSLCNALTEFDSREQAERLLALGTFSFC